MLRWFYEIGFGVPRDFEKASYYYQLAAEKGEYQAKSRLKSTNKSITKQQHEEINNKPLDYQKRNKCFCM